MLDVLLLAAGMSQRFGDNKLLYELAGKPIFLWTLDKFLLLVKERQVERIVLVTQYESVIALAKERLIRFQVPEEHLLTIINKEPELGIAHSINLGTDVIKSDACLISVCDQPYLKLDTLRMMIREFELKKHHILICKDKEKLSNPTIFSSDYFVELSRIEGDRGGMQVIRKHIDQVSVFSVEEIELQDLDEKNQLPSIPREELEEVIQFLTDTNTTGRTVISIVGAGGKTILMFSLAQFFQKTGKKVLLTTTTHMIKTKEYVTTYQEAKEAFQNNSIVIMGKDIAGEKLSMPEETELIQAMELADIVIIEADGAKHMPLKAPRAHEPVILKETTHMIAVASKRAIGQPLKKVCFGLEEAQRALLVDADHIVTKEDIDKLLNTQYLHRAGFSTQTASYALIV